MSGGEQTMNNVLISKLDIANYRGLNNVVIDGLSNINIFVGANNCGKTSVLEAVKILEDPTNFGKFLQLALLRAHASSDAKNKNLVHYVTNIFQKIDVITNPATSQTTTGFLIKKSECLKSFILNTKVLNGMNGIVGNSNNIYIILPESLNQ